MIKNRGNKLLKRVTHTKTRNGIQYSESTVDKVIDVIDKVYTSGTEVTVLLGDRESGKIVLDDLMNSEVDAIRGYVGVLSDKLPYPVIRISVGDELGNVVLLPTQSIVKVVSEPFKEILYSAEGFELKRQPYKDID